MGVVSNLHLSAELSCASTAGSPARAGDYSCEESTAFFFQPVHRWDVPGTCFNVKAIRNKMTQRYPFRGLTLTGLQEQQASSQRGFWET